MCKLTNLRLLGRCTTTPAISNSWTVSANLSIKSYYVLFRPTARSYPTNDRDLFYIRSTSKVDAFFLEWLIGSLASMCLRILLGFCMHGFWQQNVRFQWYPWKISCNSCSEDLLRDVMCNYCFKFFWGEIGRFLIDVCLGTPPLWSLAE